MLTITNYNQQTPNFQARMKMGNASKRLGTYLQDKGINANYAALGTVATTGSAGAAMLLKPELITAPAAAKYGILAGMTSTGGVMVPMLSNFKTKESQSDETSEATQSGKNKKASPLVMLALGSVLGSGVSALTFPAVQHNVSKIAEQRKEIVEQRKEIVEQNKAIKRQDAIVQENEKLKQKISELKEDRRLIKDSGDLICTMISGMLALVLLVIIAGALHEEYKR